MAQQLTGSKDQLNREAPISGYTGNAPREAWNGGGSSHTWYVCEGDEEGEECSASGLRTDGERPNESGISRGQVSIEAAKASLADFDYERGLEVCLELLRRDYDDREAHLLILDTFHALGFKNELVLRVREELR